MSTSNPFVEEFSFFDQTETALCEGCEVPFEKAMSKRDRALKQAFQESGKQDLGGIFCPKCQKKIDKKGIDAVRKKDLSWQAQVTYKLVDTPEKFAAFLEDLRTLPREHPVGIDTETTGLFPKRDKIVGISVSWKEGESYYLPIRHDLGSNLDPSTTLSALAMTFPDHFWVLANAKFDMAMFYCETGKILIPGADIMVLHALDDSTIKFGKGKRGLKPSVKKFYNLDMTELEELIGSGKHRMPVASVKPVVMLMYAAADADFTRRLYFTILEKMKKEGNTGLNLLLEVETRLIPILMQMELRGIKVDLDYFRSIEKIAEKKLNEARAEFYETAGIAPEELDLGSPAQMADFLYKKMGIPVVVDPKKGTITTGKFAVETLQAKYPIMRQLEQVRSYEKMYRDYIQAILERAVDGVMYYSLNQVGETKTGRMSSSKISEDIGMNMQQIPNKGEDDMKIRKGFLAREGYSLLDCDFSQIELRVFASQSGASYMLDAIAKDYDLHTATASAAYKVPIEEVSNDLRQKAKAVNFTLTFGGSAYTIAIKNGITQKEAEEVYNNFFDKNPEARVWMRKVQNLAKSRGYATSEFGRWIRIPEFKSTSFKEISHGLRKAQNSPVQATALDIFKLAILKVHALIQQIRQEFGEDAIYMLVFVHDEILFEVRKDLDIVAIAGRIRSAMELKIPGYCRIKVTREVGPNWHDLETVPEPGQASEQKIEVAKPELLVSTEMPVRDAPKTKTPTKLFLSIEGQVEAKVIEDLRLLFNEYVGDLLLVIDYDGETTQSAYKVSDRIVPELRRMLPRAIVQMRDADDKYVSPVSDVGALLV